jgi:uncharacterized protein (DUF1800 family)
MKFERQHLQHLLLRAGFGARPEDLMRFEGKSREDVVDLLFADSVVSQSINYIPEPETKDDGEISGVNILLKALRSKKETEQLNLAWLDRMGVTKAVLREKMILFWHNHFATGTAFAWLMQVQHNMLRKNALGNFRDLLHGISKDPAMILYLNNQQNKKKAPNENFAREVMELFSLGEGNGYTEKDIKEAARAFTGWTVNTRAEYAFNAKVHDDGEKTIFGKTKRYSGEDVIELLLAKPETARYICKKLYIFFVNSRVNDIRVAELTKLFSDSGYDISKTIRYLFTADWFYAPENIGCQVASPSELLVRYKRLLKIEMEDRQMLGTQDVLGQTLFFPPNVAGWKGGRNWLDSLSLLYRLNLPLYIVEKGSVSINRRPAFEEENTGKREEEKKIDIRSDWTTVIDYFRNSTQLTEDVIRYFIQCPTDRIDRKALEDVVDTSTADRRIITTVAAVMRLPEFQLI